MRLIVVSCVFGLFAGTATCARPAEAQTPAQIAVNQPWNDRSLSPEKRAALVLRELTLDEKISLLHGERPGDQHRSPAELEHLQVLTNGGVGFIPGIPRLGIPTVHIDDAAYGVRFSARNGRYSTSLPSNLASAASWDPQVGCSYGELIGTELRAQGYTMSLGGGVNITREPRSGRTFEFMGEDPLLAGTMVASRIRCEGEQHVITEIKHFAMNDQESGRLVVDSHIGERAAHESDLLAFELGIRDGHPDAVMCSYNAVNGVYGCENPWLLTEVLRKEWGFRGFVISDWGATHSTVAASAAGLDEEQPSDTFYGKNLKEAVEHGQVSMAELDEHVLHVLTGEFASGIVDNKLRRNVVDPFRGAEIARQIEQQSIVLLKNDRDLLPLDRISLHSVAVIGLHADTGIISGGGSAQVDPPEGPPQVRRQPVWFPSSPLHALQARSPGTQFRFASGENIPEAVEQVKHADVAILFAWQWEDEGTDLPNLALPADQDKLIAAVAAANPHTIVVLQSGSAVKMPWLHAVPAVIQAWYGGTSGAEAIADVLFGDVNPSGKLPITFPVDEDELPRKTVAMPPVPMVNGTLTFSVDYNIEGAAVGYKWFQSRQKPVLFPFGFGLSYTQFRYNNLHVDADGAYATVRLTNIGKRAGAEVAEIYVSLPYAARESWQRLAGWQKVELNPGEARELRIKLEPLAMSVWNESAKHWEQPAGTYSVRAGSSSLDLPLHTSFTRR